MTVARRTGTTSVATLFGCALTIAGAHWIAPRWSESVGLDVWEVPSLQSELDNQAREDICLTELIEASRRRMELKDALIDDLLGGRMTLIETTREFLSLNRSNLAGRRLLLTTYDGDSEEEKQARNVAQFALNREAGSVFHKLALQSKFEGEIRRAFGKR